VGASVADGHLTNMSELERDSVMENAQRMAQQLRDELGHQGGEGGGRDDAQPKLDRRVASDILDNDVQHTQDQWDSYQVKIPFLIF
jgi:hypothetical protein